MPGKRASGPARGRRARRLERMRAVAAGRRGVITLRQLLDLGFSTSAISRLVESRVLHRAYQGVFFVEVPPRPLARETAALLSLGDSAALSHDTAGFLWNAGRHAPRVVHATLPHALGRGDSSLTVHASLLEPVEITFRHGLRVTSPERTAIDLAATLPGSRARYAVNELIALGHTTAPKLMEACDAARGRRGVANLRELLSGSRRVSGQASRGEMLMSDLLATSDYIPPYERNVEIAGWEVDFYWQDAGFYLEVDSGPVHSTPEKFERDRLRDAELQVLGLLCQRITWRQMKYDGANTLRRVERGYQLADETRSRATSFPRARPRAR